MVISSRRCPANASRPGPYSWPGLREGTDGVRTTVFTEVRPNGRRLQIFVTGHPAAVVVAEARH